MRVTCISDLHGYLPELPGGDLLIVAGDLTASDKGYQYLNFLLWLAKQEYTKKIVVAGNHDGLIHGGRWKICTPLEYTNDERISYLQDSGTEIEYETSSHPLSRDTIDKKIKIWGMPWTPPFMDWHFMAEPELMQEKVNLIPDDVDILITHGPPFGILDECPSAFGGGKIRSHGCPLLRAKLEQSKSMLHVFGHIHEAAGQTIFKRPGHGSENHTLCINAAIMDGKYRPRNKPITVEL